MTHPETMQVHLVTCYGGGFGCQALVALAEGVYQRALSSREDFYCAAGHAQRFTVPSPEQKRHTQEMETARTHLAAEQRARLAAERRAGEVEKARLLVARERDDARRQLRRGLKVAAHAVKSRKPARGVRS